MGVLFNVLMVVIQWEKMHRIYFLPLGGSGVYDPAKLQIADALAKVYGVTADPFDTQGARQKYEQMLIDKEGLRDEAF